MLRPVTYTVGTSASYPQSVSAWTSLQSYPGESVAVGTAYEDTSAGTPNTSAPVDLYGYSFALTGDADRGIAQILEGLATVRGARALTALAQCGCWLAGSYVRAGRPEDASNALAEASASMEKTGERWYESELQRVGGEIALMSNPGATAEAERCFRSAIEMARQRGVKLWELRSAASLASLLLKNGRRHEAIEALTPVYTSIPETDCADMRVARSLLAELGA